MASLSSARTTRLAANWCRPVQVRLQEPGGLYNIGNILALVTGLALPVVTLPGGGAAGLDDVAAAAWQHLAGSPAATAVTISMITFIAAGEMYRRAWAQGFPPERGMNRRADFVAGVAALVLTVAMVLIGEVLLALLSGVLLAGGKFGTALIPENYSAARPVGPWPNRFRTAVLVSRVPAVAALVVELARRLHEDVPPIGADDFVMPVVMLACYLLWARADIVFLAGMSRPRRAEPA